MKMKKITENVFLKLFVILHENCMFKNQKQHLIFYWIDYDKTTSFFGLSPVFARNEIKQLFCNLEMKLVHKTTLLINLLKTRLLQKWTHESYSVLRITIFERQGSTLKHIFRLNLALVDLVILRSALFMVGSFSLK